MHFKHWATPKCRFVHVDPEGSTIASIEMRARDADVVFIDGYENFTQAHGIFHGLKTSGFTQVRALHIDRNPYL